MCRWARAYVSSYLSKQLGQTYSGKLKYAANSCCSERGMWALLLDIFWVQAHEDIAAAVWNCRTASSITATRAPDISGLWSGHWLPLRSTRLAEIQRHAGFVGASFQELETQSSCSPRVQNSKFYHLKPSTLSQIPVF